MDLLQEYVYILLDVFQKIVQNKGVRKSIRSFKKCTEKYMSCA